MNVLILFYFILIILIILLIILFYFLFILFYCNFLFLNSQSFCVCVCVCLFFFFLPLAWGQALSRCVEYKKFSLVLTSHLFFLLFSLAQSCLQNLPYSRYILNLFIHPVSQKMYVYLLNTRHFSECWIYEEQIGLPSWMLHSGGGGE